MFRGTQTEDDRGPLSIQSSLGLMHAIFIVRNLEHDLKGMSQELDLAFDDMYG